jgi:hypothetical protein
MKQSIRQVIAPGAALAAMLWLAAKGHALIIRHNHYNAAAEIAIPAVFMAVIVANLVDDFRRLQAA